MSQNNSAREALTRAVNRSIAQGRPIFQNVPSAEAAKENGDYQMAGQLRRLEGSDCYYGCHFGMRSDREAAIREFNSGWKEIDAALGGVQN